MRRTAVNEVSLSALDAVTVHPAYVLPSFRLRRIISSSIFFFISEFRYFRMK
jgi:hypothetical protein